MELGEDFFFLLHKVQRNLVDLNGSNTLLPRKVVCTPVLFLHQNECIKGCPHSCLEAIYAKLECFDVPEDFLLWVGNHSPLFSRLELRLSTAYFELLTTQLYTSCSPDHDLLKSDRHFSLVAVLFCE